MPGGSCASISGAWSASYAVQVADSGFNLRVLVWALNSADHGAAFTAQTSTVP